MFDIAGFQDSATYGRVKFDGNQVDNLVGLVKADIQSGANSANTVWGARTNIAAFERGIYGQSDGAAFTGWHFASLQFFTNGYDLYLRGNSVDDTTFGVVRSQSSTRATDVNKANVHIEDVSGLVFNSLFISGKDITRNGIEISDKSSVVINHLFLEDDFDSGITLDDTNYKLVIHNLTVGTSSFTTTSLAIIDATARRGYLEVWVNDEVTSSPLITAIVDLTATNANQVRTTIVKMPFGLAAVAPFQYSGDTASSLDVALAYTADGIVRYYFDGTNTFFSVQDKIITPAALASGNVTLDIEDAEVMRVTGDAGTTTIQNLTDGAEKRKVTLINIGSDAVNIRDNVGGTAKDRVISPTGANISLAQHQSAEILYDPTQIRWRVISTTGT